MQTIVVNKRKYNSLSDDQIIHRYETLPLKAHQFPNKNGWYWQQAKSFAYEDEEGDW